MKRMLTIGVLALSSVTWGVAFAKGSSAAKAKGGHSSTAAIRADITNLAKARTVSASLPRSSAQLSAAKSNLVKARTSNEAFRAYQKGRGLGRGK